MEDAFINVLGTFFAFAILCGLSFICKYALKKIFKIFSKSDNDSDKDVCESK